MPLLPLNIYSPGDTIPSQWANDLKANQDTLSGRTGGDPGGGSVNRFLAVGSALTGVWRALSAADFPPGVVGDAAMTNQKVNSVVPLLASYAAALSLGSGFFETNNAPDGPIPGPGFYYLIQVRHYDTANDYRWQLTVDLNNPNNLYARSIINGGPTSWQKVWHSGNDGPGSGLDAGSLAGGYVPGNGPNNIPISNSVESAGLNAALLNGQTANQIISAALGAAANQVPQGLIGMWRNGSTPPSGWVIDTGFNDRFPIGVGSTISGGMGTQGGVPTHSHVITHDHANGSTNPPSGGGSNFGGVGGNLADSHTHVFDTPQFNGSSGDGSTIPPFFAVYFIRKA